MGGLARGVVPGFEVVGPFRCLVHARAGCAHLVPYISLLFSLTPFSSPPSL